MAATVACLVVPVAALAADDPTPAQVRAELARLHISAHSDDHGLRETAGSMEPTLRCAKPGVNCSAAVSDRLLVRPTPPASLRRGAIIAMTVNQLAMVRCGMSPGGIIVKRVVGLPGDRVEERAGRLFVNGKAVREPYVRPVNRDQRTITPKRVAPRSLYVLGDNRVSSCDSRVWGFLPFSRVLGRAIAIYWPPSRVRRL